jgi:hypothetical protein
MKKSLKIAELRHVLTSGSAPDLTAWQIVQIVDVAERFIQEKNARAIAARATPLKESAQ